MNLKQYRVAINDYSQANALQPNNVNILLNLGLAKKKLGQCKAAIINYNQVIQLDFSHKLAFLNRANAKMVLEQYDQACRLGSVANKGTR